MYRGLPTTLSSSSAAAAAYVTFEWGWRRSLLSKFTVCSLGASENASHSCGCCRRERESERLSAAPATVAVADSDRRLTFGSYAASSERQRERESVTIESMGGGVETENGIGCCEGWRDGSRRVRQFLWLTQIGPGCWGEKEGRTGFASQFVLAQGQNLRE